LLSERVRKEILFSDVVNSIPLILSLLATVHGLKELAAEQTVLNAGLI
jgi:hypothetical protein